MDFQSWRSGEAATPLGREGGGGLLAPGVSLDARLTTRLMAGTATRSKTIYPENPEELSADIEGAAMWLTFQGLMPGANTLSVWP